MYGVRILTAALCTIICSSGMNVIAEGENGVAVRSIDLGYEVLQDYPQDFEDGIADGWTGINNTDIIDVDDTESLHITSDSNNYGVSADIGNRMYESALPKGAMYWTFEDDDNSEVSTNYAFEYGKWTGQNLLSNNTHREYMQPRYVEMEDVYYVNPINGAPNPTGNPPPVADSTKCVGLWCPTKQLSSASVPQTMSIRTRVSRAMLGNNSTFNLSFYAKVNTSENAVYACFRRPDDPLNLPNWTGSDGKTSAVPFIDDENSGIKSIGTLKNEWAKYETTLNVPDDAFNAGGDTILWIITRPRSVKNASTDQYWALTPGQWLYFDNISLLPEKNAETEEYSFNCKIQGKKGQKISASAVMDKKRILFETNSIIDEDNVWQNVSGKFLISDDDEFVAGENKASIYLKDNDRVKLYITSDSTSNELYIDDISLIKQSGTDLLPLGSNEVSLYIDAFASVPLPREAELVCVLNKSGEETELSRKKYLFDEENKKIFTKFTMIKNPSDSKVEFYIQDTQGTKLTEKTYTNEFFANGVNLIYDKFTEINNVFKTFGAGQYLMEFEVSGVNENKTVSFSVGGINKGIEVTSDGIYGVTLDVTEDEIKTLAEHTLITVDDKNVHNITLKKVLDY